MKKETQIYKSPPVETPYTQAKKEWDDRYGNMSVQTANWRFVAVLSIVVSLILLILLVISLSISNNKVFVAQVTSSGQVVNVAPLRETYQPTIAQEEYFVINFIKLVRQLPLDPVVAKKNWLTSYEFLTQRSSAKLNKYFKQDNPLKLLGKKTVTVKVVDINPISKKTYQVDWLETTINNAGDVESKKAYSGVFTLVIRQPKNQKEILQNPLGIYIVDFNLSSRDNKS